LDHKRNLAKNTFPQSFLFALGGLDKKLEIPKLVSVEIFPKKAVTTLQNLTLT
jgi:hypothetical protein